MKFAATGDYIARRRIERDGAFKAVSDFVRQADAAFLNLETTIHSREKGIHGNQSCGGSYLHADPFILDDVKDYGFNMVSFNNNHAFDYGYEGLLSTIDAVDKSGLVNAGVGMDLSKASEPRYLDTPNGRVALISACASMPSPDWVAGYPNKDYEGRPGINPLRTVEKIQVTQSEMDTIKDIIGRSRANTAMDISRSEGYTAAEKEGEFTVSKKVVFCTGDETKLLTTCNKADLERILAAVDEARANADFVLVSLHAHSVGGKSKEDVMDFMRDFSRQVIDHGADAMLGHGPHILRGIEIYRDRPVFYSLGDFLMQMDMADAPAEFFTRAGFPIDAPIKDVLDKRNGYGTRGLANDRKANETVVARFEINNGKLGTIELLPVELGMHRPDRDGNPAPCFDGNIIERLAELSKPFGTEIEIGKDGIGRIKERS